MRDTGKSERFRILREKAERIFEEFEAEEYSSPGIENVKELLHELADNRIELELQNEDLPESGEKIERARERYRQLFDFAPVGYFTFDPKGLILDVNLSGAKLLGVERGYLKNRPFMTYLAAESQERFFDHRTNAFEVREPQTCIIEIRNRNSGTRSVRLDSVVIPDENGEYTSCLSAAVDVTEQVRADAELVRSRSEFRTLAENLPDIIMRCDRRLVIRFVSPSISRITGCQAEKYLGRHLREAPAPKNLVEIWTAAAEKAFKYGITEQECELFTLKGMSIFSVRAVSEGATGGGTVIIAISDISARKAAERELVRARNAADDANRAKSDFLANMSHEIRTPISGILGMTDMLLSRDDGQRDEYLMMIRDSAESLMHIVNDVLDFSKIEAQRMEIRNRIFDPRDMVEKVVNPFRFQADRKNIDFCVTVSPEVPEQVFADSQRIGQVLVNLVGNALKFTERGSVRVSVEFDQGEADARSLVFKVQDTGIGIDEADKDKLFRSFTQIDGSKKKKFRGTGLGLSISRKLVDLMGGEIEAQSRIGEGSTFIFKVPPGPEPLVEAGESEPPASSKAEDYPMRVLLAEDNELNRTFVTHFLQLAGHEVTGVTDGGKAVQALDESAYDVVLMDVQMPIMDGLEATRAIRESNREYKDIPIIALTAYAMPGDRQRFLDAGMDDYVSKPVDMEALLEAMARTCN